MCREPCIPLHYADFFFFNKKFPSTPHYDSWVCRIFLEGSGRGNPAPFTPHSHRRFPFRERDPGPIEWVGPVWQVLLATKNSTPTRIEPGLFSRIRCATGTGLKIAQPGATPLWLASLSVAHGLPAGVCVCLTAKPIFAVLWSLWLSGHRGPKCVWTRTHICDEIKSFHF